MREQNVQEKHFKQVSRRSTKKRYIQTYLQYLLHSKLGFIWDLGLVCLPCVDG